MFQYDVGEDQRFALRLYLWPGVQARGRPCEGGGSASAGAAKVKKASQPYARFMNANREHLTTKQLSLFLPILAGLPAMIRLSHSRERGSTPRRGITFASSSTSGANDEKHSSRCYRYLRTLTGNGATTDPCPPRPNTFFWPSPLFPFMRAAWTVPCMSDDEARWAAVATGLSPTCRAGAGPRQGNATNRTHCKVTRDRKTTPTCKQDPNTNKKSTSKHQTPLTSPPSSPAPPP